MARCDPDGHGRPYVRRSPEGTARRDAHFPRFNGGALAPRSGGTTAEPSMRFTRLALLVMCAAVFSAPLRGGVAQSGRVLGSPTVVQINLDDVVHPVSAAYVRDGINHAKAINARAVILRLNTPGGLVDSMREI